MSLIPQSILILQYRPFSPEIMLESFIRMSGQHTCIHMGTIGIVISSRCKKYINIYIYVKR